ncbi:tail fiber domain-containing protein [Stenotrophomonas sp.]|uniref:tail fiber domain-containing protein n=1 Tax=Stenotrophomonas sp. TaxID=69392 RepID=UPI0028ACE09C|nr:tail fiber domain-containing protein [Stenotrophomonas sp.]
MPTPSEQPRFDQPVVDRGGRVTQAWANYFLRMASAQSSDDLRALYEALAARVAELEEGQELDFSIFGANSINVDGAVQTGGVVLITLVGDADAPGNTMYYGTGPGGVKGWFAVSSAVQVVSGELTKTVGTDGVSTFGLPDVPDSGAGTLLATTFDAKGRKTGSRAATITGTANQIVVTNGDAAAGLPTISLADLTDTGVGAALVKLSRDAKGRVSGTQAATTTDLAEGANLYFTNARADARITAQKGQPNGIADLDAGGKVPAAQIPAIDHNTGLSGLQGGTSGQYYHLTSAELARIPPIGGTDAKLLRGDSVWSNDLVGPLLVRDTMQITSGTPAFFQATSTGGIQSVLSSNDSLAGGVGFFGTLTAHDLAFVAGSGVWLYMAASGANLRPNVDNATAIGTGSNRFSVVFAATGSINTSDEREKTPVRPLEQAEISAAAQLGREIGAYKWLASVEAKGDAARWHIGMTVQRAIEVMQSHGLDPFAYGFICYDSWEEKPDQSSEWPDKLDDDGNVVCPGGSVTSPGRAAGDLYSFRPDGLHAFILRGLAARLEALEARLTS